MLFPDGGNPGGGRELAPTTGCHDITTYVEKNIAAGACMGDGILMDIKNRYQPVVTERVQDRENFAFWHSATFNNDGTKVIFTDELGGGGGATCNPDVGPNRGANGIYDISRGGDLVFASYYKIPRTQTNEENCVAHNGSLIPVEGRDIMVQAWYMGGISSSTSPTRRTPASWPGSTVVPSRRAAPTAAATGRRTGTTATCSPTTSARALNVFDVTARAVDGPRGVDLAPTTRRCRRATEPHPPRGRSAPGPHAVHPDGVGPAGVTPEAGRARPGARGRAREGARRPPAPGTGALRASTPPGAPDLRAWCARGGAQSWSAMSSMRPISALWPRFMSAASSATCWSVPVVATSSVMSTAPWW